MCCEVVVESSIVYLLRGRLQCPLTLTSYPLISSISLWCLSVVVVAGSLLQNPRTEYRSVRKYQGKVKAVILDWAGTVLDCGVYSPAVVFVDVFEHEGVPITMEEARGPMGAHKKVHIRKITQIDSVRLRWKEKFDRYPNESDVERMFANFVPLQVSIVDYVNMLDNCIGGVHLSIH